MGLYSIKMLFRVFSLHREIIFPASADAFGGFLLIFAQTRYKMLKLQTKVECGTSPVRLSNSDGIMLLGSCFADNIGARMSDAGFDVCVNPFGTLYNPVSLSDAVARLESGTPFTEADCVEMGAGAGLVCSFHHHTSFARKTPEEFLEAANASLAAAHERWRKAGLVILTLGTAYCFRHLDSGLVVSNCLKRPAREFARERLSISGTQDILRKLVDSFPDKRFILTVSPIRHMGDGAHANQLSKASLLLAADVVADGERIVYFPAYEIVMDELRDYRFYAEDMVHPSAQAVDYIWERFIDFALPEGERQTLIDNMKACRCKQHRPMAR